MRIIQNLLEGQGFGSIRLHKDLAGKDRVIGAVY